MTKNIIIVLLVIAVTGEGLFILKSRKTWMASLAGMTANSGNNQAANHENQKSSSSAGNRRQTLLTAGMKLADTSYAQISYKIAPGSLTPEAQKAMAGWGIKTQNLPDGSIQVNLTPKSSDDFSQQFTVRPGNSLYFVEITGADDNVASDKDANLRDDFGIIVNKDGIVQ
ncbi:hypothetical protein M1271_01105 [Patescibacteria group bacterium]|nr:hypothetical protein [Patescibacteria group bacterium]MCL5798414.1 hypothetical protein [Patescibacteria group bacterium]